MTLFIICIFVVAVLWTLGFPIYMSFFAGATLFFWLDSSLSLAVMPIQIFSSLDSWVLIAVPLYVLAGNLMAHGKISRDLVDFMEAWVGWLPGGLWIAATAASMFFGAMCGSGVATTAAIGSALIGPLLSKGYPRDKSMGLIAACGTLGNIIPPSIAFVVVGSMAQADIAKLFMGGLLPGIAFGIAIGLLAYILAVRRGIKGVSVSWDQRLKRTLAALPALVTPGIILGGIYGGIFTPTEAAAIACLWGFVLFYIYREPSIAPTTKALIETVRVTSTLFIVIAAASVLGYILIYLGLPQALSSLVVQKAVTAPIFLIVCWALWMILACFIDGVPIFVISVPSLWPAALALGIDPIFFGVFMVSSVIAGQATPPFGTNLFAMAGIAKAPLHEIYRGVIPFAIVEYVAILGLLIFPGLATWLPSTMIR